MTACLAECRAYSRNDVAVDSFTESQVAAPDSLAYPKAVPPGNARASGVNKFFENIKPLSDLVCAILDEAGRCISKLLGFDEIFHFDSLINWGISAVDQEERKVKSVEQYLLPKTPSASERRNVVLPSEGVKASSSGIKNNSPLKKTQAAHNSMVRNTQGRYPREGAFNRELSTADAKKMDSKRFIQNSSRIKIFSVPKKINPELNSKMDALLPLAEGKSSVSANAEHFQVQNSQSGNLQKEWEGILFDSPGNYKENFGQLLTSTSLAPQETWNYV